MSGESFPTAPAAEFREMIRTMRLLGSAEIHRSVIEDDLRPRDGNPPTSRE